MSEKAPTPSQQQYDSTAGEKFLARWFKLDAEAASIMAKAMAEVKKKRDLQKEVVDDAEAAGFQRRPFKKLIKHQQLEMKIDELRESLEPEDQDHFDNMMHALGMLADTPLGQAAQAAAGGAPKAGIDQPAAGTA